MVRTNIENNLLRDLSECEEREENSFLEIPFRSVITTTEKAALFHFDRYAFKAPNSETARKGELWFPLSMLRKMDDDVLFNTRMAIEKGLNV